MPRVSWRAVCSEFRSIRNYQIARPNRSEINFLFFQFPILPYIPIGCTRKYAICRRTAQRLLILSSPSYFRSVFFLSSKQIYFFATRNTTAVCNRLYLFLALRQRCRSSGREDLPPPRGVIQVPCVCVYSREPATKEETSTRAREKLVTGLTLELTTICVRSPRGKYLRKESSTWQTALIQKGE